MVSNYGTSPISTQFASSPISQRLAAYPALPSFHALMHATTITRFSSCSSALLQIPSSMSTRSPRIPPSTVIQSPTQRPFKHQTVSSLCLLHIHLPLSMYFHPQHPNSPSSTLYRCHRPQTSFLHYQVVCSHTHRPLRHPRQPMQTNMPMQPRILDQPQRPWPLWTRQSKGR